MHLPRYVSIFSSFTQRAQAVLQAVSAVQDGSSPSSHQGVLDVAPPPSPVLRIIIDNMFYPVTLDVLQQVKPESFPWRWVWSICFYVDILSTITESLQQNKEEEKKEYYTVTASNFPWGISKSFMISDYFNICMSHSVKLKSEVWASSYRSSVSLGPWWRL